MHKELGSDELACQYECLTCQYGYWYVERESSYQATEVLRKMTRARDRAKDRQITFYADPDVYEWLKSQPSVTRCLNTIVRGVMHTGVAPADEKEPFKFSSDRAMDRMVQELEDIQNVILKSYDRQQAMIGALKTHQKLFEKSASFYKEIGRIKDEQRPEPIQEAVSHYNELVENSAETIMKIIASSEQDFEGYDRSAGFRERLIAAIDSDKMESRSVNAPARSFRPANFKETRDS